MNSLAHCVEWTDRDDVCRRLAEYVTATPREEPVYLRRRNFIWCWLPSEREQAIRLLCHLARPKHAPLLASVAGNLEENLVVREMVFPHLLALGGELPEQAFVDEDMDLCFHTQHHWQEAAKFLLLFRNSISIDRLAAFLETARTSRAEVLSQLAGEPLTPPEWLEWLYERWIQADRHDALEPYLWTTSGRKSINATIAYHFRDRRKAAELLHQYRVGPPDEAFAPNDRLHSDRRWEFNWDSVVSGLWGDETELLDSVRGAPTEFRSQAESLRLPFSALELFWSREEILNRVEGAFRTLDLNSHGAFPQERNYLLKLAYLWPGEEVDERLTNLYLCPETPSPVRSEIYDVLWVRSWELAPEMARLAVRTWPESEFSFWRKGQALLRLAESPQTEDRPFFLWAADMEKRPEFRFLAIRALACLGEDSAEWRARLNELRTDADRDVRIAAAAALLRLGDEGQRRVLVEAGQSACDPITQREALQSLGEIERARHLSVFAEVLQTRPTLKWGHERTSEYSHATLEAARQLALIGTGEALTELLRGCLRGGETTCRGDRCAIFAAAVRRWEGEEVELPGRPYWRWERPWEWRCA